MTKDEKAKFDRILEILERIDARLGETDISPAILEAVATPVDDEVMVDAVYEEVSSAQPPVITQDELMSINIWLQQITDYLRDEGAAVYWVLSSMGARSLTDLAQDRGKIEQFKSAMAARVAALQPGYANA